MKSKALIVIVIGFMVQLVISCCNCNGPYTYNVVYVDFDVYPYDIDGFYPQIITDTVYKNSFGLEINMITEQKLAKNQIDLGLELGFSDAKAFSCECEPDEYLYPDMISQIKIYAINQLSEEIRDVTSCFAMYHYDRGYILLQDVCFEEFTWENSFQIKLVDYEDIPQSVIFEVKVMFESNSILSSQTEVVNFH